MRHQQYPAAAQAHHSDTELGGEPPTQTWDFAPTDAGAAVYAGLNAGVTRASFEQAIVAGTVAECLER